jgi:peptidoglycan/LPS O-acetylase OafA/YrhL
MPYLFWSFATIVIFQKYNLLKDIILVIATGNASYHLWYMAMSIRIYLWFPIISEVASKALKKSRITQKTMFLLFFIAYWAILKEQHYVTEGLAVFFFGTPSLLEKRLIQYSPIFWSIYFVCGVVVCLKYENFKELVLKHSRKIVFAYIPLVIYMYYMQVCNILPGYFPRIAYDHLLYILYMLLTAVIIYIASVKISRKAERFRKGIRELGSLSYGAYLIHVIVLQLVAPILRRGITTGSYLVSGIIIFIATFILSFALCYIIRFLPLSEYIIGVKRRSQMNNK